MHVPVHASSLPFYCRFMAFSSESYTPGKVSYKEVQGSVYHCVCLYTIEKCKAAHEWRYQCTLQRTKDIPVCTGTNQDVLVYSSTCNNDITSMYKYVLNNDKTAAWHMLKLWREASYLRWTWTQWHRKHSLHLNSCSSNTRWIQLQISTYQYIKIHASTHLFIHALCVLHWDCWALWCPFSAALQSI